MLKKVKAIFTGNRKKVLSNVLWAMSGKIVNLLGVLFVGILIARYLGPEQYGLMNYIISYVSIFSILASFGLDNIEIREISKNKDRSNYILGTAFRIRLFFAISTYLLIIITLWIFRPDRFTAMMILAYSTSIFSGSFNVIRNYFTSILENEYVVKSEIARTLIGAAIKISLLLLKAPLAYFILATAFDTFLVAGGYIVSYKKKIGPLKDWKYDRTIVPFFLREAFPLVLSGAAVVIYQKIDQVMIGNMIDKESVGYFATAGKFLDLILFLPMILTQTVTPILVRKRNENIEEYEIMKQRFVNVVVWFSIIIALVVSLSSNWLIYYSFGTQYVAAIPVLQIMAWKTVGMALSTTSGQIIIMEGIQKWVAIRNLFGTLICIGLNFIFIPKMGIIGAAWVTLATVSVSGFISHFLIKPYRPIAKIQLKAIFLGWNEIAKIKKIIT